MQKSIMREPDFMEYSLQPTEDKDANGKIPKRVCAGMIMTELRSRKMDAIVGAVIGGLEMIVPIFSPVIAVVIGVGGLGYFVWRYKEMSAKLKYLGGKYGF